LVVLIFYVLFVMFLDREGRKYKIGDET